MGLISNPSFAVVGGGFAGLACSNFIINAFPNCVINLYDLESSPGTNGASSAAGGLMHPFTPKGKLIWKVNFLGFCKLHYFHKFILCIFLRVLSHLVCRSNL